MNPHAGHDKDAAPTASSRAKDTVLRETDPAVVIADRRVSLLGIGVHAVLTGTDPQHTLRQRAAHAGIEFTLFHQGLRELDNAGHLWPPTPAASDADSAPGHHTKAST